MSEAAQMRRRIEGALLSGRRVTGADFRPPTFDGGAPCWNITPRISELRRDYLIETDRGGPGGTARYWIVGLRAPEPEEPAAPIDAGEQAQLFDPPPAPPACAIAGWLGE